MPIPGRREPSDSTAEHPATPSVQLIGSVIALGGAFGACLRHALHLGFNASFSESLPSTVAATLFVNIIGAGLLGHLSGQVALRGAHPLLQPFLGIGILGSFTTYASLISQNTLLVGSSGALVAALHLVVSGGFGLIAFSVGQASVGKAK